MNIQIESIAKPFDDPATAACVLRLISRAEGMGLLENVNIRRLNSQSFLQVMRQLKKAGIRSKSLSETVDLDRPALVAELKKILALLEESPVPRSEWMSVLSVLGSELLQDLLHLSASSIRRYATQERETPQEVAGRLHFIAVLVGDLKTGYNDYGIRRWFQRPRSFLKNKSVKEVLGKDWSPDSEVAESIRNDAAWVVGSGAA